MCPVGIHEVFDVSSGVLYIFDVGVGGRNARCDPLLQGRAGHFFFLFFQFWRCVFSACSVIGVFQDTHCMVPFGVPGGGYQAPCALLLRSAIYITIQYHSNNTM